LNGPQNEGGPERGGNREPGLDHHLHAQEETLTTNPKRGRLRLADPAASPPDDRAEVARSLLYRYAPTQPVTSNEMLAFLGFDVPELHAIERDPRYLIGRLTQALSALLQRKVPPPDATGQLLMDAIADAMAYRQRCCAACGEGVCAACEPGWQRAAQYETLYGLLGLLGERPAGRPELAAVTR
jgi:hypothetical protein